MDWFEHLTGFRESGVDDIRAQFDIVGDRIISRSNGRSMQVGRFEAVSLGDLRRRCPEPTGDETTVREMVGDAQALHMAGRNAGATFQVASQFNTLEMPSPSVTPEAGVAGYQNDHTQGPACAVACGAGTIWRNYFVEIDGRRGQTATAQLDCLGDLVAGAGSSFTMENGYALPTADQLAVVCDHIGGIESDERDELADRLQIGLQWDTEVTLDGIGHTVTQAYCSALPVAYSVHAAETWEPLARLVLEAAYDATLAAACINAKSTGNRSVFLTLVGGGVFGNPAEWIIDAIGAAHVRHGTAGLDVVLVSFSGHDPRLDSLLSR